MHAPRVFLTTRAARGVLARTAMRSGCARSDAGESPPYRDFYYMANRVPEPGEGLYMRQLIVGGRGFHPSGQPSCSKMRALDDSCHAVISPVQCAPNRWFHRWTVGTPGDTISTCALRIASARQNSRPVALVRFPFFKLHRYFRYINRW